MGQSNDSKFTSSEEDNYLALRKLIEAIIDDLQTDREGPYEALESYSLDLRSRIYVDPDHYRHHFIRGYQILLDSLEQ